MSLLVPCPSCGQRDFTEFAFGGETKARPRPDAPAEALARYLFLRRNAKGPQQEWWYHRAGCRSWFLARRETSTNRFLETYWPEDERRGP
jgi:heterotetrameric sarcosine oxidase delta subunit